MNNRFTFAQVEQVLAELSFRKRVVPRKGVAYDHDSTRTMLLVSIHKPNEMVPDYVFAYIRHQLDAQGICERADFEGMLRAVAA